MHVFPFDQRERRLGGWSVVWESWCAQGIFMFLPCTGTYSGTADPDDSIPGRWRRTVTVVSGTSLYGARVDRRRRMITCVLLGTSLVLMTGCATGGEDNWNSTAVGDDESVGEIDLLSVLLVTDEEGNPARLLGTLENNGDQPVDVTISDDDEDVTVSVPAQGAAALDTLETFLQTAGDAPGARTSLTATTETGEVELLVPVVDGTLDPYKPYLPE